MATVKEKVAGIEEMERRVESGVAELHQGMRETTDRVEAAVDRIHRETRELEARFDNYAREDFWG